MKAYIKPEITVMEIETTHLLADSQLVIEKGSYADEDGTSLSKETTFFDVWE